MIGAVLSVIMFSLTVVSFPLLLDRDVDFITAMITSVRAVVTSPRPLIGWAFVIVMLLAASALPAFLGLIFTLPCSPCYVAPLPAHCGAGDACISDRTCAHDRGAES